MLQREGVKFILAAEPAGEDVNLATVCVSRDESGLECVGEPILRREQ